MKEEKGSYDEEDEENFQFPNGFSHNAEKLKKDPGVESFNSLTDSHHQAS